MKFDTLKNNDSFCILPFIHQEKKFNGTFHVCCYGDQLQSDSAADDTSLENFNSQKMQDIRTAMMQNKRHHSCNFCYQQEDLGIVSPRMRENDSWMKWKDTHKAITTCLENFDQKKLMRPISYDLRYSNTCTLKCRMCNSSSSSSINAEYKKLNQIWPEKFWVIDNLRINHDIEFHNDVQKIYLAGGEPLVEPLNLELLNQAANYNDELVILINTSLNIVNAKFFEVLQKFKFLTLVVSIDGTNKVNDYIRHGSNFEDVKKNLQKFSKNDKMFSTCVSIYNIFNLGSLIKFIQNEYPEHAHNHSINIVNDIEELFIENIPYKLRPAIINELNQVLHEADDLPSIGIKNCITILEKNNFDEKRFRNFVKYTKILDKARQESIKEVVPQLAEYFDEQG